jgi:hypothetical protein
MNFTEAVGIVGCSLSMHNGRGATDENQNDIFILSR